MSWPTPTVLVSIVASACVTAVFVNALQPTTLNAQLVFTAWLILPHVVLLATLAFLKRRGTIALHWLIAAALVCAAGIFYLADAIYWHPDAQGAIAVLMAPIYQFAALAIALPLARMLLRRGRP